MNKLKRISLVTLGTIALFTTATFAKTGTVNAPSGLVLREEKSKTSDPITTVTDNAKVEILEESGEWYKVKYNDNEGYLFAEYVEVEEETEPEKTEEPKTEETPTEPAEEPETNSENNTNTNQEENKYPQKQKIKADLKVYTIPSVTANTILNIKKDEEVTINYELNNWVNITYGNNTGWARKYFIANENTTANPAETESPKEDENNDKQDEQVATFESRKAYIDVSTSANIRKEASTSSEVIDTLLRNAEVTIIGEEGEFYKIKYEDITGYISKSLVTDKPVQEVTSRGSTGERKSVSQENAVTEEKETQSTQTAVTTTTEVSSSSKGNEIATFAKKYIGYNYVYGGSSPSTGFDCSGFASYVYNSFGYSIGRTCSEQISKGTAVSKSNLLPGDLVFFNNGSDGSIGHVGIYIGDGQMVHSANSRTGVKTDTINSGFYNKYYYSARRIIK